MFKNIAARPSNGSNKKGAEAPFYILFC